MIVRPSVALKHLSAVEAGELFKLSIGRQNLVCLKGSSEEEMSFLIILSDGTGRPPHFTVPQFQRSVVSMGKNYSILIDHKDVDFKGSRFRIPGCITLTEDGLFLLCEPDDPTHSGLYYNLSTGDVPSDDVNVARHCIFGTWSLVLHESQLGPNGFAPSTIFSFTARP